MTRFPILTILTCFTLWLIGAGSVAHAQGSETRELALQALKLEFERDQLAATPEELDRRFRDACERGYNPACRRSNWLSGDEPHMERVEEIFKPSCEAGDPVACLVMSWALDHKANRETVPEEQQRIWRRAVRMLKRDCDGGFGPACHEYASFLYENKGIDVPTAKPAVKAWNRACDLREYAGCTKLARLHRDGGRDVVQNNKAAGTYAKMACDAGYADGCFVLGRMEDRAWSGSNLDQYYDQLCQRGHKQACWYLARVYYDGLHQEPSTGRIQGLFERACDLGHPRACFEAGKWEQDIDGEDAKAARLFGQACKLEDAAGCSAQVDMILGGKAEGSVKTALNAFDVACEQRQSIDACEALAFHMLDESSLERNPSRGRELLMRVCRNETSDPQACFVLGTTFETGLGGDRDRTEAGTYYRWACSTGYTEACIRRGVLLREGVGIDVDHQEALRMFGRACDGQIPEGCHSAGLLLTESPYMEKDPIASASWHRKGCDASFEPACVALGNTLMMQEAGPDNEGAREAFERALEMGSHDAKRPMAKLLWQGDGGSKKRGRAKQLCREACRDGDAVACRGPSFLK